LLWIELLGDNQWWFLGQLLSGWTYAILTIGCSSFGKWTWHNTRVFFIEDWVWDFFLANGIDVILVSFYWGLRVGFFFWQMELV
jgi:hypothetical protein